MIVMAIVSMLALASADTAASAQRAAFSTCLKQAIASGKSSKVAVGGFDAYVRAQCAAPEAALRNAVIAIDVKNGISRKDAAENARLELEDYFVSTAERYQAEMDAEAPQQAQAQAQ